MTVTEQNTEKEPADVKPRPEISAGERSEDPFHTPLFDRRSRSFDRRGKGHWAVPWSDLMMTMFVFFAILYIYTLAHRDMNLGQKDRKTPTPKPEKTAVKYEGVNETLRDAFPEIYDITKKNVSDLAQVELVKDKAVRITLTNDLLFETGKADLKEGAKDVLNGVADVIKQTPYIVNVVGHTDDMPIHTPQFPTNWELSATRACVVVRYMIENMGIPGERFFISAHSYFDPIQPNDSQKHRADNRRVDIIITRDRP